MQNVAKTIPRTAIPIGNKEIVVLSNILSNGITGKEHVEEFENEIARYLSVKKAFAFNSGRTALSIALQALELKPGTEVLVPAYTCAIVFEVILRLGLKVVPVDVDPATFNINPDFIDRSITPNARVVIPIHLFGQPCHMDQVLETARKHGLYVIEDAAQALGATYKKTKVGRLSDLSIFSFGPGKSITSGEGGALAINHPQFEDKVAELQEQLRSPSLKWNLTVTRNILAMKMLSNKHLYGRIRNRLEKSLLEGDEDIVENCIQLTRRGKSATIKPTIKMAKMPAVSAEIAKIQLRRIDNLNKKRRANAAELSTLLADLKNSVALPETSHNVEHTFTRFTVRILKGSRESLMTRLLKRGIDTERPFHYLPQVFEAFRTESPNAVALSRSALTLPNHPLVKSSDLAKIATDLASELD